MDHTMRTIRVSLGKFDDNYYGATAEPILRIPRDGVKLGEWQPLTADDYIPRGGTPLRDAVAGFIAHIDGLVAKHPKTVIVGLLADESGSMHSNQGSVIEGVNEFVAGLSSVQKVDKKAKVMCVVLTDGLENASKETSAADLADLIAERERRGWTFIYLGANQDAWATGQRTGFSTRASGQTVSYAGTAQGTRSALRSVSGDTVAYLSDTERYTAMRANSAQRSVTEDGTEVSDNTGVS